MDVKCVKCGEPWDVYGLKHGDVKAWEADMILKGVGCPCCQGIKSKELTILERVDNESALEGDSIEESNSCYNVPEHILIHDCENCQSKAFLDQEEIFYDGRDKVIYDSFGKKINILDKQKLQRYLFAKYNQTWKNVEGVTLCSSCYEQCDSCNKIFKSDQLFFIQDTMESICEDCYCEKYDRCSECDVTLLVEDSHKFDNKTLCDYCYEKLILQCEVCKTFFNKKELILGMNDEVCCSEKCADKTTEQKCN